MPLTFGRRSSSPIAGGAGIPQLRAAEARGSRRVLEAELLEREKPVAVFGAELGEAIRHDVDDRAREQATAIEAAAEADVERQIVAASASAREHHAAVATMPTPVTRTCTSRPA